MSNFIIEARSVVKDYAHHRALDHVTVNVPKGGIYGLLGPNGAGKSTLIRILNRITAPDEGEIIFDGHPFTAKDQDNIGYLPEERGLYRKMKVGEQALYLAELKGLKRGEARKKLHEWFERLDIMTWWNRKVQELSKGMAQKIQFVCTVIHEPELLIFDEPFSGFDPINAEILKTEMLRLRDMGHTIIFSTHNMQSVEELCNRITLINKSHVVLEGDTQLVRNSYKGNKYSIMFDSEVALPEWTLDRFGIIKHQVDGYGRTELIVENTHKLSTQEILGAWNAVGPIIDYKEIIPSMHEIFLDVVNKTGGAAPILGSSSAVSSEIIGGDTPDCPPANH